MGLLFRRVFVLLFIATGLSSYSQIDEFSTIYGGLGYYRHTSFDDNSYYHLRVGTRILSYKFIAPEVDFTYYFGGNNRVGERDLQTGLPVTRLFKNFRGKVWGLSPSLYYGDEDSRIIFIPKYHFGTISSEGIVDSPEGKSPTLKTESSISFWSFSLGIEDCFDSERYNFGIYLTYTGFNAGASLNKISFPSFGFENSDIDSRTLSLNIRLSYSLWN